jgi:hypothetical protein
VQGLFSRHSEYGSLRRGVEHGVKGFAKMCRSNADGRCTSSVVEADDAATATVRAFTFRVEPTALARRTDGAFSAPTAAFTALLLCTFLRVLGAMRMAAVVSTLRPSSALSLLLRMFSALSTARVQSDNGQFTEATQLILACSFFSFVPSILLSLSLTGRHGVSERGKRKEKTRRSFRRVWMPELVPGERERGRDGRAESLDSSDAEMVEKR